MRIRPNLTGFRSETQAGVRGAFAGIGKIVGVAIGAVAVGEIVKSSVAAAASIQKQLEVVRFEFGRASQGLIKFADTAGIALGDSNRATDEASARFGLLFKSLGVGQRDAARMTLGFEKLALSVNAIRGGGGQGAGTLLQSIVLAAAGNTRGLKQMGIVVDATSEKIAAFKLGLITSMTQALTPAQKTEAIYAIATAHLGQTMALAKAHAGDLANVQAKLSAEFMLVKERLGNALLPAMAKLVGFLADKLPGAADFLAGALKSLRAEFDPVVRVVRSVVDAFKGSGGLGGAIARLRDDFSKLGPAAKLAVIALGGIAGAFAAITITSFPITSIILLGAALTEAYRRSARFRDVVGGIGRAMEPVAAVITNRIVPAIQAVAGGILHSLGRAFTFVGSHARIFEVLGGAIAGVALAFKAVRLAVGAYQAVAKIATVVQVAFDAALNANPIGLIVLGIGALVGALTVLYFKSATVRRVLHDAFTALGPVLHSLVGVFRMAGAALHSAFNAALPVIVDVGHTIKRVFTDVLPILRTFARIIGGVVVGAVHLLQAVWRHFGGTFIAIAKGALGTVVGVIKGGLEIVRGIFDFITGLLTLNWRKAWKGITEILGGALHGAMSAVKGWGHIMVAFFTDLWHTVEKIVLTGIEKVVHLLAKIPTGFSVFGHHFGFTNPFQGWEDSLKSTIAGIGKTGKQAVKTAASVHNGVKTGLTKTGNDPGTKSVAKQTGKKIGDAIGQGAADGVAAAAPQLQKTLSDTLQRAVAAANAKIESSVRGAKNNLDKIGQDLAKTIGEIQAKLGGAAGALAGSPQGKAFQKLKQLIESGAPSFEIQRARAALSSQLQNVGKTTGTGSVIGTQLANLTAEFNKGQIGYKTFQKRLHEILSKDGFTLAQALKAAGPALADQLKAEIRAMAAQAKAIAAIPKRFRNVGGAGGGSDIKIIRPLEVIKAEGLRLRVVTQKAQAQAKAAAAKQQALQKSFNQVQIAGVAAVRHGTRTTGTVRDAVHASTSAAGRNAAHVVREGIHAAKQRATGLAEAKKHTALLRKIAGEHAAGTRLRQVVRAHQATTAAVQAHHRTARERPRESRKAQINSLMQQLLKASLANNPARVAALTARLHRLAPKAVAPVRPIVRPVIRPVIRSIVRPVIRPIVRPVLRSVVRPVLRPVLQPVFRPVVRSVTRPILRPVLRPVTLVRPIFRPVFKPLVRPVTLVRPVIRAVFRPVVSPPVLRPILRPVFTPIIRNVLRPVLRPVFRPILRPVVRTVVRPLLQPVLRPVTLVRPVVRPVLRPVFRPVLRNVFRPLFQPILRPIVRPLFRPVFRPLLHTVVRPVLQPVLRPVTLVRPVLRPVIRPVIRVQAARVEDGRLLALLQASVTRLLLPLNALRLDGLRVQQALTMERTEVIRALTNLQARLVTQDRALLAAELRLVHPINGLRSDQARIAANAAAQRERLLRSSERGNALLRKLDRKHHGPQPGHGKTPYGAGSHHARQHAMTGGR